MNAPLSRQATKIRRTEEELIYRGPGEVGIGPVRIVYFSKNQYFKGIILNHVGPCALDTDLSKVLKNMCFDPKI